MKDAVCSDLHRGKPGHPANDETPGFDAEKARREAAGQRVWSAGDMNELLQFSAKEIGTLVHTDVRGNHDRGSDAPDEIWIGPDTLLTHGNLQIDPWVCKVIGPLACWLYRWVECVLPAHKPRFGPWVRRRLHLGRHGSMERAAYKMAEYAASKGARQVVFGHLHQRFERDVLTRRGVWVHVVCVGCYCDGHRDFVTVTVQPSQTEVPHA